MTFVKSETVFLCEIEFRYGGKEFPSCKIDSLFGKIDLHVGDFQFCSDGIDIHFGEIQMEKVYSDFFNPHELTEIVLKSSTIP